MMADKPNRISHGQLTPLCSLELPLSALVGYWDAQAGIADNPFAADSAAASEWIAGYDLAALEGAARLPRNR